MRAWLFAPVALAFTFLVSLDEIPVRHAAVVGMAACSAQQFLALPGNVDFLALGSSRVMEGISTRAIESASRGTLRSNFNFGRSDLSALRSYVILRDVFEQGVRPKFVFVELNIETLKRNDASDSIRIPPHAAIMKFGDISILHELHNDLDFMDRNRLQVLAVIEKIRGSIIPVLSGVPVLAWLKRPEGPIPDCQREYSDKQLQLGKEQLERHQQTYASRSASGKSVETIHGLDSNTSRSWRQELFFLEKIRMLCSERGVVLVVSRHWAAYEPLLTDETVAGIQRLVPEFIYPSRTLIQRSWAFFRDVAHMGPKAREEYSSWLASRIMSMDRM